MLTKSSSSIAEEKRSESVTISDDDDDDNNSIQLKKSLNDSIPKLRLNTSLASDPALQPEARDIQCIRRGEAIDSFDNHSDTDDIEVDEKHSLKIVTDDDDDDEPPSKKIRCTGAISLAVDKNISPRISQINSVITDLTRHPPFMCLPCGIKFSSKSTLEAHQTYYCTHK